MWGALTCKQLLIHPLQFSELNMCALIVPTAYVWITPAFVLDNIFSILPVGSLNLIKARTFIKPGNPTFGKVLLSDYIETTTANT